LAFVKNKTIAVLNLKSVVFVRCWFNVCRRKYNGRTRESGSSCSKV